MADSRPARSTAFWQWTGLSVGLLAITALAYVIVGPPPAAPVPPTSSPRTSSSAAISGGAEGLAPSEAITEAISHYEHAIAELQAATAVGSDVIEPATQASLLAESDALDRAIADSRRAVAENPDSEPARLGLFEALHRKIAMLQATMSLINEMQQNQPTDGASTAGTLGRKSS